jgi:hypothetical protein
MDGIPTPDGFYSLYLRDQRDLFTRFFVAPTNAFPAGLADFLSISAMSDPVKLFGWQTRPTALPCYTLGAAPMFLESANIPGALLQTNFDPRQVVYLPLESKNLVGVTGGVRGTVHLKNISAQQWDFDTEAGASALLVLSQSFYHPWRAYVDGKPTEIFPANFAFQAVQVPAGRHQVRFIYQDRYFEIGGWISVVALAGCVGGLMVIRSHRRRSPTAGTLR